MSDKKTLRDYLRGARARTSAAYSALQGDYAAAAVGRSKEGLYRRQRDEARLQRDAARRERDEYKKLVQISGSVTKDYKILGEIHKSIGSTESEIKRLKDALKSVSAKPVVSRFSTITKADHFGE